MDTQRSLRLLLCLLAFSCVAAAGCDEGDFERPVPSIEIQPRDAVYVQQDPSGFVTLAFFADQELTAPLASTYAHDLQVVGAVGPARRIKSIDVEHRLWVNTVTITTVEDSTVVFDVDRVEHRGVELHLQLTEPLVQSAGVPY